MINFITLFDKNYLSRGLVLYGSLLEHCVDFHLFILAMDMETEKYFIDNMYERIEIISLDFIEAYYSELVEIKKDRSRGEYCWTLTPFCIQYAIRKYGLDSCTYIDADICFYSDPKIIIEESKGSSVIITEHKYTPIYDQTYLSGKYCVQFMYFKNDGDGQQVLE
ncbi:hypothetical protein FACS1894137_07040 [Spirochaetia bacterium]|nr:hypothetical protein FACS1894137_07040 [Spirochaetia bacterium]